MERENPAEPVDGTDSSEKKMQGSIRTNIDTRRYNKGARHTRYLQDETEGVENYKAGTRQTDGIQDETEGSK